MRTAVHQISASRNALINCLLQVLESGGIVYARMPSLQFLSIHFVCSHHSILPSTQRRDTRGEHARRDFNLDDEWLYVFPDTTRKHQGLQRPHLYSTRTLLSKKCAPRRGLEHHRTPLSSSSSFPSSSLSSSEKSTGKKYGKKYRGQPPPHV